MTARTPMLQQYFRAKDEHPGVLLAMRVGDFYEFYGDDAELAAEALEITLTARDDGGNRMSMAGVPFHSVEKYLARLLQKGLKVAICDQLEDPKAAKGLVKRGVTRVLTPGTLMEDSMLPSNRSNFLAAICMLDGRAGLAILEPSTGDFSVTEVVGEDARDRLMQELARIHPAELLVGNDQPDHWQFATEAMGAAVTASKPASIDRATRQLLDQFEVRNLQGFGCEDKPSAVIAASMILSYAETNRLPLQHLDSLSTYSTESYMRLDPATRRSLEITVNLADGSKRYTLLETLDRTRTKMGARLLRKWLEQPLLDTEAIQKRLDATGRLVDHAMIRGDIREILEKLSDLERLVTRVSANFAQPRDLSALKSTLNALPELAEPLRKIGVGRLQELREQIGDHSELARLLERAIVDDPPMTLRDGGIIRHGFDLELDKLRDLTKNGKSYIASLEQAERESTGITNLKVGYNSVFGYYLEVSKSQIDKVPAHYIRKQTTANAERYITAELKDHESLVLGAQEKATSLESQIFSQVRARIAEQTKSLLETARAISEYDVLAALAETASLNHYVKPTLTEEDVIEIEAGRHPVVESQGSGFVPNDLRFEKLFDSDSPEGRPGSRMLILTGPNMAGKSTYLRQAALIVLMAQIGSFVPAKSCRLGLCDRIFARIGAKDELALGQSTFMVEMVESANILNHATERSLVILDEVGRGTSTFDGLAIAWAMVERLVAIGAKTMFATHYHQLNTLADQMQGVANFRVAVEEIGDDIVWTHRVLPGGADRSYGIHVARMAGIPQGVLNRAAEVLTELEEKSDGPKSISPAVNRLQLSLFEAEDPAVVKELQKLDVDRLTPMDALKLLDDWKSRFVK